jgi:hypothetical protein
MQPGFKRPVLLAKYRASLAGDRERLAGFDWSSNGEGAGRQRESGDGMQGGQFLRYCGERSDHPQNQWRLSHRTKQDEYAVNFA